MANSCCGPDKPWLGGEHQPGCPIGDRNKASSAHALREDAVLIYPSQIKRFEAAGYVRGRDFIIYSCLMCLRDMDVCSCKTKGKRRGK